MTSVAGASRFLNSAILANKQGQSPSTPSILDGGGNLGNNLLSIGRNIYGDNGVGLSANARAYNEKFLNETKSGFNAVFGMSTINLATVENMQQTILALRAKLPQSQIAESLRGADTIAGSVTSRGNNVNTTA